MDFRITPPPSPCSPATPLCLEMPLRSGCKAQIVGLKGRGDLNGTAVTLLALDADSGRWGVQSYLSGERVKVRVENLQLLKEEQVDGGAGAWPAWGGANVLSAPFPVFAADAEELQTDGSFFLEEK